MALVGFGVGRKSTYGSVGGFDRPSYLQAQAAKSEQEQEPTALGLFGLLFAHPVVVIVVGRHGLLEERIDFGRHALRYDGGRVIVNEFYAGVSLGVWTSVGQGVAAEGDEFGSWSWACRSVDFRGRR